MLKVHFVEANSFDFISWVNAKYDIVFALRDTGRVCIFILNKEVCVDKLVSLLEEQNIQVKMYGTNLIEGFLNSPFSELKMLVKKWNS